MHFNSKFCTAIAFWITLMLPHPAVAERRVALVVGNSGYMNVPRLPNPRNDASDMITRLKAMGFDVVPGLDLDRNQFLNTLASFGRAAEGADVALFFYAGHGLQVNGQNYLVPTDAKVEYEAELEIALIPVPLVMQQLTRGSRVNIVLLDACRDNPFAKDLSRTLGTRSSSALGRGLNRIQTASGTFIAFATQPDNVAQDGAGRNSPFTGAFLANMDKPGLSLSDLMIEVRNAVIQETNGKQVPWDSSSLTGRFSFKIEGTVTVAPQTGPSQSSAPVSDTRTVELGVWNAIRESSDAAVFHRFLKEYPESLFAPLARERIAGLAGERKAALTTPGSPAERTTETQPILLSASSVDLKRSRNIEIGGGLASQYGANVLHNAPPYGTRPNAAEWVFSAPAAGRYRLDIEFAAMEARPVKIIINGRIVRTDALNETTGGWSEANQTFRAQGSYDLRGGDNRIRLERANVFPHIRALRFVPEM
ncbi:peptidase [Bradyrhizobium guangdongense]|uniref:caspase family protein n=1 Tax=Bradyrhizobium guangdongense TaxID=1325090 RepID=UPI00112B87D9|nr:caspase family protein [Bradyrhizobium guangdongense]TPQ39907.1 peptidase [Bradyrhizobium guangdongense]